MAPLVELFHVPKFRSTRVLWLYYELEAIYGISRSDFPKLKLHKLSPDTFRNTFASACQFMIRSPILTQIPVFAGQ